MSAFASARRRVDLHLLRRCASYSSPPLRHTHRHVCSMVPDTATTSSFQQVSNFPQQTNQIQIRHMAGHNKWSKIKRKKAANDVARLKDHTKAARAIEAASRACQGDMADIHLQSTISAARGVQLPKERMERAIERGANPHMKSEGEEYIVRRYDGMIPTGNSGKVAVIVETLTENRNRTAANVRHLVTKTGGELLPTGANEWMFEHVGLIWVSRYMSNSHSVVGDSHEVPSIKSAEVDMDALLECALEGGATDVEFGPEESDIGYDDDDDADATDHYATIKCELNDMLQLVQTLKVDGYATTQFEKQWLLKDGGNKMLLDNESAEKFEKFLNSMDDDVDVTNVFHNASFVDE
mmetsp:Transcript_7366/g.16703  ORF Transcript_7366/g.16703 Transcript_7366/m.16703 type:complete len:353 (+) Transcript_7366:109-1167(+)